MMVYPDGTEARVGDSVVIAHRTHTGTVQHLIESVAEMDSWNVGESGLMIATSYGGWVVYPDDSLTVDEIECVSRVVA